MSRIRLSIDDLLTMLRSKNVFSLKDVDCAIIETNGKILKRSLREFNISYQWVYQELRKIGINSVTEVLYTELQSDGTLFIDKYKNN